MKRIFRKRIRCIVLRVVFEKCACMYVIWMEMLERLRQATCSTLLRNGAIFKSEMCAVLWNACTWILKKNWFLLKRKRSFKTIILKILFFFSLYTNCLCFQKDRNDLYFNIYQNFMYQIFISLELSRLNSFKMTLK